MKTSLFILIGVLPMFAAADDALPNRPDFNRYQAMLNRSFAIETVALATTTPNWKDLYISNVDCFGDDCFLTLASANDKNFKEQVRVKRTDMRSSAPK